MATLPKGSVMVIFVAQRNSADAEGYAQAAGAMDALSAQQPGYLGMDSVRSEVSRSYDWAKS